MPTNTISKISSTDNGSGSHEEQDTLQFNGKGDRFHAGRAKWGKYKEKEAKRRSNKNREALNGDVTGGKDQFDFPDGGWVCADCQNYNFAGRAQCNRCKKRKGGQDMDGKPKHLQRSKTDKGD